MKYIQSLIFSLTIILFGFSHTSFAKEPILDYKHEIYFSSYSWQIESQATDTLQIFKDDEIIPLVEYDLSGCMFCSGDEDGCDKDRVSGLFLADKSEEPFVVAVCHVGAHSRQLQVFAPLRNTEGAVFTATGAYSIDYEMDNRGITVTTDHRTEGYEEFTQLTEYWPNKA